MNENDEMNETALDEAEVCAGCYAEAQAITEDMRRMEATAHALAVSLLEQATERDRLAETMTTERQTALAEYIGLARRLPGIVPELVGGESLPEVFTSLQASQAAYHSANVASETSSARRTPNYKTGRRSATALQDSLIRQGFEQLRLRGF
jgi:hypothetical protein